MSPEPDLGPRLEDLADALDAPSGDGVARAVVQRLASSADLAASSSPRRVRRPLVALGAVALATLGGVASAPAVADWFGVRGVEVERRDDAPTTPTTPTTGTIPPSGASLDLGTPAASLAAAERDAGFAASVPTALGAPDAVWVDRRGEAPFISLVYDGGPLVTEFDATVTPAAVVSKIAGPDTVVEELRIHGEPALWIEGVHEVAVRARSGDHVVERLRLSDRVLLVQHGRLTVRIELPSPSGRADAVRIAESLPR